MNLSVNGKLLRSMRKAKGMTQKQVAEKLGVMPKTVSKWETGHGFPDTSLLADLSRVLGVSVDSLLSGALSPNPEEVGNFKEIRFYVCPHCGSMMQGMGECRLSCCGAPLEPLKASENTAGHRIKVERVEDDFYITFEHEMTKEHYISFVSYVSCDRVLTVKLYPEQDCSARVKNMLAMAEKSGEPMRSCYGYGELEKMLEKHSFLIYEFLNREAIQNRFFTECNNEMTAFESIYFAQAVLYNKNN